MPDKFNFDVFEPVGEDGGEEFVVPTRYVGPWGAALRPSMSRSSPMLRNGQGAGKFSLWKFILRIRSKPEFFINVPFPQTNNLENQVFVEMSFHKFIIEIEFKIHLVKGTYCLMGTSLIRLGPRICLT